LKNNIVKRQHSKQTERTSKRDHREVSAEEENEVTPAERKRKTIRKSDSSKKNRTSNSSSEMSAAEDDGPAFKDTELQESEVWDIERDDFVLPSQAPAQEEDQDVQKPVNPHSESHLQDPSTIVLDASRFAQPRAFPTDEQHQEDSPGPLPSLSSPDTPSDHLAHEKSPSLGPSESASQILVRKTKKQKETTSRFFDPPPRQEQHMKDDKKTERVQARSPSPARSASPVYYHADHADEIVQAPTPQPQNSEIAQDGQNTILTISSHSQLTPHHTQLQSVAPQDARNHSLYTIPYETASEFQWLIAEDYDDELNQDHPQIPLHRSSSLVIYEQALENAAYNDQQYYLADTDQAHISQDCFAPEQEDSFVSMDCDMDYPMNEAFELQELGDTLPDHYYWTLDEPLQIFDDEDEPVQWLSDVDEKELIDDELSAEDWEDDSNALLQEDKGTDEEDSSIYGYFDPDMRSDRREVMSTRFLQGREILTGISGPLSEDECGDDFAPLPFSGQVGPRWSVRAAEDDVARHLRNHWLPYRL
jgi:hypothetical protein